jgi:hypothetical protein
VAVLALAIVVSLFVISVGAYFGGHTVSTTPALTSLTGRIEVTSAGDCVLLVDATGHETALLFDSGTRVSGSGELTSSGGEVIARAGDSVTVAGPAGGVGDSVCLPGHLPFLVEQLSRLSP